LEGTVAQTVDLYAEDGFHELPLAPPGVPSRIEGRENLRKALAAAGGPGGPALVEYQEFEDLAFWQTTDPEVVISEYLVRGRVVATGASFGLRNLLVLCVRDGLIRFTRSYASPGQLAELLRPPSDV
jgi:ketosteroid isomerase-like protein